MVFLYVTHAMQLGYAIHLSGNSIGTNCV